MFHLLELLPLLYSVALLPVSLLAQEAPSISSKTYPWQTAMSPQYTWFQMTSWISTNFVIWSTTDMYRWKSEKSRKDCPKLARTLPMIGSKNFLRPTVIALLLSLPAHGNTRRNPLHLTPSKRTQIAYSEPLKKCMSAAPTGTSNDIVASPSSGIVIVASPSSGIRTSVSNTLRLVALDTLPTLWQKPIYKAKTQYASPKDSSTPLNAANTKQVQDRLGTFLSMLELPILQCMSPLALLPWNKVNAPTPPWSC